MTAQTTNSYKIPTLGEMKPIHQQSFCRIMAPLGFGFGNGWRPTHQEWIHICRISYNTVSSDVRKLSYWCLFAVSLATADITSYFVWKNDMSDKLGLAVAFVGLLFSSTALTCFYRTIKLNDFAKDLSVDFTDAEAEYYRLMQEKIDNDGGYAVAQENADRVNAGRTGSMTKRQAEKLWAREKRFNNKRQRRLNQHTQ